MSEATPSPCFAVIAGGGTAGHVVPGLAIAAALVELGHEPPRIHYVGSARGIERTMVPAAGFPLTLLPGRGIQRRLTAANVGAVAGLVRAVAQSLVLVRRLRPRVVVALGGYASVPTALAAFVWRVPIVVAEQNAVPGAANRLVARVAKASAVSFAGTALPRAVLTGNPVRAEVLAVDAARDREAARAELGLAAGQRLVLAFGGSLGARRVNDAVLGLAERWAARDDVAIHHVIGERDWERERPRIEALTARDRGVRYRAVAYEHDMARRYAAADVVVCRAGASTVAELTVVGLPAVLVPLPHAPGDHQTANARALVDAGAAVLLPDADCEAATLADALEPLLDPERARQARTAARGLAHRDAARRVAELVARYARLER